MIPINLLLTICGSILIVDGAMSMILVNDLRWQWQLARILRIAIGVIVLCLGI